MADFEYSPKMVCPSEAEFSSASAYRRHPVSNKESSETSEDVQETPASDAGDSEPKAAPFKPESRILIDTIHDGYIIPPYLRKRFEHAQATDPKANVYDETFFSGRDWGASIVAHAIAERLGCKEFYENTIARNVLDFNRFPGISRNSSPHLDRLSISGGLTKDIIEEDAAERVITLYKSISERLEDTIMEYMSPTGEAIEPQTPDEILNSRFIRLSIHTFDTKDSVTGRRRPKASIVHRSDAIDKTGIIPANTFHHLFPPELATFTGDRMLKSALSCGFETNYVPEHSDSPYMHPVGGVEMRFQAWLWFRYLRLVFEEKRSRTVETLKALDVEGHAYAAYWRSVTNPNSIHPLTHIVRAFVDRRVVEEAVITDDKGNTIDLHHIWKVERAVADFYEESKHDSDAINGVPLFVRKFQYAPYRPSTLVIEIRKDEIFHDFNPQEHTAEDIDLDFVGDVAKSVYAGIRIYEHLLTLKFNQHQNKPAWER